LNALKMERRDTFRRPRDTRQLGLFG
jgi:hypothetical protein